MKGLLIKDFKLMKMQRKFFFVIVMISVGQALFSDSLSVPIGFATFVFPLFTLSTISYDEFDNGNAFLFSLPITRAGYVVEKYCFALILALSAWTISTLLVVIAGTVRGGLDVMELVLTAAAILPVLFLILAVMLPVQLKFGGEKGRIALIIGIGAIFLLGFLATKISGLLGVDLLAALNSLPDMSVGMLAGCAIGVTALILLGSALLSIRIVRHKEF